MGERSGHSRETALKCSSSKSNKYSERDALGCKSK